MSTVVPTPWVVSRSSEFLVPGITMRFVVDQDQHDKPTVAIEAPGLYRDSYGFLWYPATEDLTGQPNWNRTHPVRQRRSMDERLCQVCARGGADVWIIPPSNLDAGKGTAVTGHPPLCRGCLPIAQRHCPHLRAQQDWRPFTAAEVRPFGVMADVYAPTGAVERRGFVTPSDLDCRRAVARQRVVRLLGLAPVAGAVAPASRAGVTA
jgi:hypothetical protein